MLKCVCVYLHLCVFQVAMSTMDNPLLKYNAKEYFFKASLCHFIVDELNAKVTHTVSYGYGCMRDISERDFNLCMLQFGSSGVLVLCYKFLYVG